MCHPCATGVRSAEWSTPGLFEVDLGPSEAEFEAALKAAKSCGESRCTIEENRENGLKRFFSPHDCQTPMTNQPRLCLRTTIQFETGDAELLYQTENLSASGVLVRATPSLPVGTRAALRLELPRELGPIEAFGMVVRHTDVRVERIAGFAIQFIELDQNDRARLEEFLDQQRTQ